MEAAAAKESYSDTELLPKMAGLHPLHAAHVAPVAAKAVPRAPLRPVPAHSRANRATPASPGLQVRLWVVLGVSILLWAAFAVPASAQGFAPVAVAAQEFAPLNLTPLRMEPSMISNRQNFCWRQIWRADVLSWLFLPRTVLSDSDPHWEHRQQTKVMSIVENLTAISGRTPLQYQTRSLYAQLAANDVACGGYTCNLRACFLWPVRRISEGECVAVP